MLRLSLVGALLELATADAKANPVAKVIELLGSLKVRGEESLEEERKVFAKYTEWVDDEARRLGYEIKTSTRKIDKLRAVAGKADKDAERFGREVEELQGDIARYKSEREEESAIRQRERREFLDLDAEYKASIDAIARALKTLQAENLDRPQAEMLLQSVASHQPLLAPVVTAFLQESDDQTGAPAAAGYKFQSEQILDLLEKLQDKMKSELSKASEEESSRAHNYELIMQHTGDGIKYSQASMKEKAAERGRRQSAAERAKGELAKQEASLADDKTCLQDLKVTHDSKAEIYNTNQRVRQEELRAVDKARELVSSGTKDQNKEGASFVQTHAELAPLSFLQKGQRKADKVADLLAERARKLSSTTLASVAATMRANPFAKVIGMVKDLIAQLKEEAAEQEDHKNWCDGQLTDNKIKREKKSSLAARLDAEIDELQGRTVSLSKDISEASAAEASITRAMAAASDARSAEKAKNEAVLSDSERAAAAVRSAMVLLREFYEAQSAALIQEQASPDMKEYKGMQGASKGVLGMLEIIESDCKKTAAETKGSESQAAGEYEDFMKDAKENKAAKEELLTQARLDRDQVEFDSTNNKKELADASDELASAEKYFLELKTQCLEATVSWETRMANRKAEIQALKEAYTALNEN